MSQRRVLLLDDDARGSRLRAVILTQSGFVVHTVSNLSDARVLIDSFEKLSAIVVATSEFNQDTIQFCAELKSAGAIPILMIGHSVWPAAWDQKYYDVYVQKLDGPSVWIRKLRELISRNESNRAHGGVNILNVDDNEAQRYATTKLLLTGGYKVIEAATGQQTLELAAKFPDLILLDVNLPDMDGFEVCRRLRGNPETAHIAIVHLSATFTRPEARTKGLRNGADEYLCQPIGRDALLGAIDSVLSRPIS